MNCEKKLCYKKCSLRTFVISIAGIWMGAQCTSLMTLECSRVMYKSVPLAFAADLCLLLKLVLKHVYVEQENHAVYHSEQTLLSCLFVEFIIWSVSGLSPKPQWK